MNVLPLALHFALYFCPVEFRTVGAIALQCMQLHIGCHELAAALIHNGGQRLKSSIQNL